MIPIYIPYIEKYTTSAKQAIDSLWISNYGINVQNAKEKLSKILDVNYCILMNNGTSATNALLIALKYKHPNISKLYVPNNVFIAPYNCALQHFEKSQLEVMKTNPETLNIDTSEDYIKTLTKDSAVLIVHNLGNVVNVPRLKRLRPDLIFIEDNCEGLFGKYEGIYTGASSSTLCSAVSFYANKTLTTGEGGAFLTNDLDVYKYINSVYSHGMTDERYIHDKIAYNYRMTNIQAGFLYDQLSDLDHILNKKNNVFKNYDVLFKDLFESQHIIQLVSENNTQKSNWMYCIIIPKLNYKKFEKYMEDHLIQIRPFFYDIRRHKHLQDIEVLYPECETNSNGVMLPCYPELESNKQEYIANCIKNFIKEKA